MKKLTYLFLFIVGVSLFSACHDQQTYADQKNRERAAINKYLTDSLQLSNVIYPLYARYVETMDISNKSGTMTGSFDKTSSLMYTFYGTTTVPTGWMAPLRYLNIGRWDKPDSEIAKVRIIVPHDIGQSRAVSAVYPCLYDITYQRK